MNDEAPHAQPQEAELSDAPTGTADRRRGERRQGDRRSGLDRRRGPGRRRTDYRRAAEEGYMNEEQLDFLRAMEEYKRVNNRPFPSLTEILDVLLYLGYRRVAPVGEFALSKSGEPEDLPEPPEDI